MSGIKDQHNLDDLRDRLYSRGNGDGKIKRHTLSPQEKTPVSRNWSDVVPKKEVSPIKKEPAVIAETASSEVVTPIPAPKVAPSPVEDTHLTSSASVTSAQSASVATNNEPKSMPKKKKKYRQYVLIGTFLFMFVAIAYSAVYLFFGANQISPTNVTVAISGPFSVGGGSVAEVEVTVVNENNAPIRSATLIVSYPPGTKTEGASPRDLFEERLQLNDIASGETVTVPVRPVVFGEENQEHSLNATVEYRLEGSNGTFFKDADPLTFKISSSPLVIRVDAVDQISSGQETDITLTLQSNSPSQLNDILVVVEYPNGFDFTSSLPEPSLGQNTWLIETIEPESSVDIVVTGVVIGQEEDEFEISFSAGTPSNVNRLSLGSLLTTTDVDILIERPFIDFMLSVNGDNDGVAVLSPGQRPDFVASLKNTLEDPVYDVRVTASFDGNAFREDEIFVDGGFYDSTKNEARWGQDTMRDLVELLPGSSRSFRFNLTPQSIDNTPEVEVKLDVYAKRVASVNASEELIGTITGVARISTEVNIGSEVVRGTGDTGPIPPEVEQLTDYTVHIVAKNSTSDITGGVVTFQIPPYVVWQDDFDGDGDVIFNPVSREVTWDIGNIDANEDARLVVGVGLRPSTNQVDSTPVIIGTQRFRGTDRFTGIVVRNEAAPLTSELSQELGFPRENGTVVEQTSN